jgi:hypothetical protein
MAQTIWLSEGTANVAGPSFDGDTYNIGVDPTINLSGGAQINVSQQGAPDGLGVLNVNVSGNDGLSLAMGGPPAEHMSDTFDLTAHSNLLSTDTMGFGQLTVNGKGATDTFTGYSSFSGTQVILNTDIMGTGSIITAAGIIGTSVTQGSLTINGSVGAGVTILTAGGSRVEEFAGGGSLTINDLSTFKGTVIVGLGETNNVQLSGLDATSYDLKGDILSLYNGNKLVDKLNFQNQSGQNEYVSPVGMQGLTVSHNSLGVQISTDPASQNGGVGTPLTLHP